DLVLLHQVADPAGKLLGHPARPLDYGREVTADAIGLQPEVLGAVHQVEDFDRPQQGLGRDAAPVETDAAKMLAFDDGDVQPQLRTPDRGDIAAGAGADHDHVESLRGHALPPSRNVV